MAGRTASTRGADDWVERVRAATDIVEFIGQTVALRRVGRNWVGLCPFHREKTPSFSVNVERQFYHCFSCKAGGDVFKFVQETEGAGFLEAVEMLSRRAGIAVPERRAGDAAARGRRARLIEAIEAATAAYEQWLGDPSTGGPARAALERRGIAADTRRAFRLGWAPPGWEHLTRRLAGRFPADVLVEAGLAGRRDGGRGALYDRFRGRIMVPLVAPGGDVLGFGARAMTPGDEPKYLNSPETPVYHKGAFLFALDAARRHASEAGEIVVVEGYFDAIALHQAGLRHAVATSGTALTADQARLLRRQAPRVALTYDGDDAGREAMMRSLGVLLAEGLEVVVVDLPPGEDPDTLVRREGIEGWRAVRDRAADPVGFVQRHLLRSGGTGDPRERALQAVVSLGTAIRDPVGLALLLERAEAVLGLPTRVLERAVALRRAGHASDAPVAAAVRAERREEQNLERLLLQALLAAPEELAPTRERIGPGDFRDPGCEALARWLWEGGRGMPAEEPAAALVRELSARTQEGSDWAAEARGATRRMTIRRLQEELKSTREKLAHTTAPPDRTRLVERSYEIARTLRDLSA